MSATTTKSTTKSTTTKAVRELKGLRTSARNQAANLNHCCRCCRGRQA